MIQKTRFPEKARVEEKLAELVRYYQDLLEDLPSEEDFFGERLSRRGIEKTMELIADAIIDLALILVSSQGFEKPADSREAITILEKNKVLSSPLAAKIKDLISFRNLIVHRYGKIEPHKEYTSISENHKDIPLFVKEIQRYVNSK